MVLLVERLSKFCSKLENRLHPHHEPEALQASLQAFKSDVSICLNQLTPNSKPGSEFPSFSWIQRCFGILPVINKAFAKLVVDIDFPISKWEAASAEEYLNYSLSLLELLNSISSSISHLGQARLALSHALGLVENSRSLAIERLNAIKIKKSAVKDFREPENRGDGIETSFSDREKVVHQALRELKSIGIWVCGVLLAGLSGDAKPYLEKRKPGEFANSALSSLDSSICEIIKEKGGVLKEVRELNDSVGCLAVAGESSEGTEKLRRRLEVFEKMLDSLGKEVDHLFSKLLAGRNELLGGIQKQN
ncbi:Protein BPS1 chloroplastic [Melia azedarach]|uniref:Protein BPS1 chloroplastic n=1 Tax=Melia azedarach TaxID=155640 RepID=A0ACC1XJA9_MELAZ|nr:Protein BPS1 chloroplastic [Melia azedarach]